MVACTSFCRRTSAHGARYDAHPFADAPCAFGASMSSVNASTATSFADRDPANRAPSSVRPTGQVNALPSSSTLPQVTAAASGAATADLTSLNQALTQLNTTVQAILNRLNGA